VVDITGPLELSKTNHVYFLSILLYNAEFADDFGEDDSLSRDALRVPSRVAIERRRRRRRCRRPQLQTTQLASLFRNVADRLQRSTRVPRGSTATTATSTQTPMVEAAVQCESIAPPSDDEGANENYDDDAAEIESDLPTLPTFIHNVIDHHGHPIELYVASLPLSSPAARPTLKIYISPVCPPLPNDAKSDSNDETDNVSDMKKER
jgi:hypothetical protein